jgi:hypothetical protein
MRKAELRAIERQELEKILSEFMPGDSLEQVRCKSCGKPLKTDEIGAIQLIRGKPVLYCTSLECLPRSTGETAD